MYILKEAEQKKGFAAASDEFLEFMKENQNHSDEYSKLSDKYFPDPYGDLISVIR